MRVFQHIHGEVKLKDLFWCKKLKSMYLRRQKNAYYEKSLHTLQLRITPEQGYFCFPFPPKDFEGPVNPMNEVITPAPPMVLIPSPRHFTSALGL